MSGETRYTPGPWAYEFNPYDERERGLPASEWSGLFIGMADDDPSRVSRTIIEGAVVHGRPEDGYGDPEADARLIAAAPELYEALAEIERHYANQDMSHHDFRVGAALIARDALAKARGES